MSELVQVRKLGVGEAINQVYSSYEEMIRDVKAKLTVVEGNILKARWLVGWQAFILMDDRKYGDHSVEEFATSLDMSTSSVYECKRFYESFSKEELNGVNLGTFTARAVSKKKVNCWKPKGAEAPMVISSRSTGMLRDSKSPMRRGKGSTTVGRTT